MTNDRLIDAINNLLRYMPHGDLYRGAFSFTPDMHNIVIASNTVRGVLYELDRENTRDDEPYDNGGHPLNFGDR